MDRGILNLPALLERCVAGVARRAEDKGLGLGLEIDPLVPAFVLGDEAVLSQVLSTLLAEAVATTPAGSVDLAVDLDVRSGGQGAAGVWLCLRLRASAPLGPTIAAPLVEALGGTVTAEADGVLRVAIELPDAEAPGAAPSGLRILYAEDNAMNQELVAALLERAGHRVDLVGNGAAAVEAVRHGRYDLVLMDLEMPVLDGASAARALRALDGPAARVPIVAVTAYALPNRIAQCFAAGMNEVVTKPVDGDRLLRVIAKCCAGAPAPAASALAAPARFGHAEAPVLDRRTLVRLEESVGREMLVRTAARFLDGVDERLQRLRDAAGDRRALGIESHALVGLAGNLGLSRASEACRRLMDACEAEGGESVDVAKLAREAEIALKSGADALRRVFQ